MEHVGLIMSLMIGLTFLLSGLAKIGDLKTSGRIAAMVGILPDKIARVFGIAIPFLEIIIGILLLLGQQVQLVIIVAELLSFSFLIANLKVIIEGKDIACNCFGKLLSSTMGIGGLMHSIILLFCGSIPIVYHDLTVVFFVKGADAVEIALVALSAIGLMMTGLLSREVHLTT